MKVGGSVEGRWRLRLTVDRQLRPATRKMFRSIENRQLRITITYRSRRTPIIIGRLQSAIKRAPILARRWGGGKGVANGADDAVVAIMFDAVDFVVVLAAVTIRVLVFLVIIAYNHGDGRKDGRNDGGAWWCSSGWCSSQCPSCWRLVWGELKGTGRRESQRRARKGQNSPRRRRLEVGKRAEEKERQKREKLMWDKILKRWVKKIWKESGSATE